MKNFAVILAGGIGQRMGESLPKQFIKLSGCPIIILTIRRILSVLEFDKIIIVIHPDWKQYLQNQIEEYRISTEKIIITSGGKERLDSIKNSLKEIMLISNSPDDIVVICDAVRPFVSKEILQNSIKMSRSHGACVCALPAIDTMLYVENNIITSVPLRKNIFHGQAPDSFQVSILNEALNSLTEGEKKIITGTAQICVLKHIPVYTIPGDIKNIKITSPDGIKIAENILQMGENK